MCRNTIVHRIDSVSEVLTVASLQVIVGGCDGCLHVIQGTPHSIDGIFWFTGSAVVVTFFVLGCCNVLFMRLLYGGVVVQFPAGRRRRLHHQ